MINKMLSDFFKDWFSPVPVRIDELINCDK
mgnify:CR=1 FL=1|jgi:hypothetical protein